MKQRKVSIFALASAGMALVIPQTSANPTQITSAPNLTVTGSAVAWGTPLSSNPADNVVANNPRGQAYQGQVWDLEAFSYDKTTGILYLTGGFDFSKGYLGGLGPELPGDLFIRVGPANSLPDDGASAPSATGSSAPHGAMLNQFGSSAGPSSYTYVVDLSSKAGGVGLTTPTVSIYTINGNAILDKVNPSDFSASNPWKLDDTTRNSAINANGLVAKSTVGLTYTSGLTGTAAGALTGVNGLVGDSDSGGAARLFPDGTSDLHNVVALDLSSLAGSIPAGYSVYLSYTFECGNDSLKGIIPGGGFRTVAPEGGATLMMLGMGLACLTFVRSRVGKA